MNKKFYAHTEKNYIIDWLRFYYDKKGEKIAYLRMLGTDIQNNPGVFISNQLSENDIIKRLYTIITRKNLLEMSIYLAVRKVITADWLNDRDQFLFPNNSWQSDEIFKINCLIYVLFINGISSKSGINHWIPFTEQEVNSKDNFQSHFMSDFLKEKTFSPEAQEVLNSGRELWKYYHSKTRNDQNAPVDASFYDIREFFQGRSEKGTMKQKSDDETYNALIKDLRQKLSALAEKIKPKVYEYGFLWE
jgi:hypothetical protein